jgi:hypothetical protein
VDIQGVENVNFYCCVGFINLSGFVAGTLYPHKLAITSPASGGRSVGIVRSRTQFSF